MTGEVGSNYLAVDIGGTKLAAAVVTADGAILSRGRTPTHGAGPEGLFSTLVELVDATLRGLRGVGGRPRRRVWRARWSCTATTVSPLNITQWRGFPLRARLAERYELPDVRRQRRQGARAR